MSEDLAPRPVHTGRDEAWCDYLEAVSSLGDLPELRARRHRNIAAEQDATLAGARRRLDAAAREAERWRILAKRSLSNAQAKLVAAKVLIPDVGPVEPEAGDPDQLIERLHDAIADVDRDVVTVRSARRRAEDEQRRDAATAAAAALRRRRLVFAAIGAGALLLVVLLLAL